MRNTFEPSEQQKRTVLEHIHHEMQQLAWLCQIDRGNNIGTPKAQPDAALWNARIEAILLHVRTLLDFFECSQRKRASYPYHADDVISEDFGFDHVTPLIENQWRDRINKALTHLTYSHPPLADLNREWDWSKIVPPIARQCCRFIEHIEKDPRYVLEPAIQWGGLKQALRGLIV
ncbi:MAG: hypothetical protein HZB53_05575 [Chloroflexi bacterium]|nr:hypothetical protein [Chloroflexota bacterium]